MLVDSISPQGPCIEFLNADSSRVPSLLKSLPKELQSTTFLKTFKKDLLVDLILERLYDVDVYYIHSSLGRGEELYYFSANNKLYHGDKVWSSYHEFMPHLCGIKYSSYINFPCWFAGSRNNYTHQLVDLFPNLLVRSKYINDNSPELMPNVFGEKNPILDTLSDCQPLKKYFAAPSLYLGSLGTPVNLGSWQVRCIRFGCLYLLRHISIFTAFNLIREAFNVPTSKERHSNMTHSSHKLLYLARNDNRVQNQEQIINFLLSHQNTAVLYKAHELSLSSKMNVMQGFDQILLPPGSDNINALCFSPENTHLFQMIPAPVSHLLNSPFLSYAGLRYLLPFMHRLIFFPATTSSSPPCQYGGYWHVNDLACLLNSICSG